MEGKNAMAVGNGHHARAAHRAPAAAGPTAQAPSEERKNPRMKKSIAALVVVAIAVAGLTGSATAAPTTSSKNIVQTAVAAGKFKTLVSLVKQAGLAGTLAAPGNVTVFAPTDQAFASLKRSNPALFAKVASDKKLLRTVLTYHVVGKRIPAVAATAAAKKGLEVKTLQGERIALSFKSGRIVLNGSGRVVIPDVKASNGVIHAINAVLVPPSLLQAAAPAPTKSIVGIAGGNPNFSTLVALVQKAGLVEALSAVGPFTVFAPTNEAFEKLAQAAPATYAAVLADPALLARVLTYHVVAGAIKSAQATGVAQKNDTGHRPRGRADLALDQGREADPQRQRNRRRSRQPGDERRHPRHRHGHRPAQPGRLIRGHEPTKGSPRMNKPVAALIVVVLAVAGITGIASASPANRQAPVTRTSCRQLSPPASSRRSSRSSSRPASPEL